MILDGKNKRRKKIHYANPFVSVTTADALPDATLSECLGMLTDVKSVRRKHLGERHVATGEAYYVLGLMLAFVEEFDAAIDNLNSAKEIFAEQYVRNCIFVLVLMQIK